MLVALVGWPDPSPTSAFAAPSNGDAGISSPPALPWAETDKLLAPDGAATDYFGISVSLSDDTIVVGGFRDDDNGLDAGAAYVYQRNGAGGWDQVAKLLAADGAAGDYFGLSVAIDGDRIVVGAYEQDDNGTASGAAYVFERDGAGDWLQVSKLLASDGTTSDAFGLSVGISGDRIVVGGQSSSAYIFEHNASGSWLQDDKVVASDGAGQQYFGQAVAIAGDRIVIGAFADDDIGTRSGSAYVFERVGPGDWVEAEKLVPVDGAESDYFGISVAIAGDRLVVGAYRDGDGLALGSAYVYERNGAGDWLEADKLVASDAAVQDYLGYSVAIEGDRIAVGAFGDDGVGLDSGSTYIYVRDAAGDWAQVDKLAAADGAAGDQFGYSVAISGDRAIIGASSDDNIAGSEAGAAYVFELAPLNVAPTVDAGSDTSGAEGATVSLTGSVTDPDDATPTIAWSATAGAGVDAGATCTFTAATSPASNVSCTDDGTWNLTLTADDGTNPPVADSLTLSVTNAVPVVTPGAQYVTVGEAFDLEAQPFTDAGANDTHTATIDWGDGTVEPGVVTQGARSGSFSGSHTYATTGTFYVRMDVTDDDHDAGVVNGHVVGFGVVFVELPAPPNKLLASDGAALHLFGYSVSISGDRLVVGAYGDADNGANSGAAYVFDRDVSGAWTESAKVAASDGTVGDLFGTSVSISGDRLVVGAHGESDSGSDAGAVYVFERNGSGDWIEIQKLRASDGVPGAKFGYSVSISGGRLAVGGYGESAYVYERDTLGVWLEVDKLVASDAGGQDYFGAAVAIAGDRIVVGASSRDSANGSGSGAAYVFERDGGGDWAEVDLLLASDGEGFESLGQSVAIDGGRIVVGAIADDDNGSNSGSAYVYERNSSGNWLQVDKLLPVDGAMNDLFGYSVAIAGGRAIVNSYGDDDLGLDSGSAYVFEGNGAAGWTQVDKLLAADGAQSNYFGQSVAVSGDRVVAGAFGDGNIGGAFAGAAYVFELSSLDSDAPTATIGLPIDGSRQTQGDVVFASYVCDDGDGSGVASCIGTVPNGAAIETSTLGIHSFTVTAADLEGNIRATSVTYEVVAAGDTVAPQIWINRPADGAAIARYTANVTANFSCADIPGSGIASCTGTQPNGSAIVTTTPGTYSLTVTAVDLAGNSTTRTATYTILGGTADTAPPYVSIETPVHLARYATGSTHRLSFTCTDTIAPSSGIATCAASRPNSSPIDTSVPGTYGISFSSVDNAGNVGTNYRQYIVVDDSDGDGLSDQWETNGIDVDGDAVIDLPLNLAPYNADPNHRDVFVEMDYMTCTLSPGGCAVGDRTSQAPQPGTVGDVIAAFAAAPLMNPDGTIGIRLHLNVDEAVPEIKDLPFITRVTGPDNDFEDIRSGGPAACDGRFGTVAERASPSCPKLIQAKAIVFRYGLWAHSYLYGFGSSGIGEMPGNDFLVTTGANVAGATSAGGTLRAAEAGTLMHELGHTLGLGHGGKGDSTHCKPNYLSVMNYALQFPNTDPTRPLDYSRAALPSLFEGALIESAGVGGPSGRYAVYGTPAGVSRAVPADGPIDWNNDGDTADTVSRNINDFCAFFASSGGETLRGADDWSDLVYSFTAMPGFAPGSGFAAESLLGQEVIVADAAAVAQVSDFDGDGIPNATDVCPAVADPEQSDLDHDGIGTACEIDLLAPAAAPTTAPAPNAAGWNVTNVTVTWHWTDELDGSGIDPARCTTSSVSSGQGSAVVVPSTCADRAGNVRTASQQVKVDATAPVIACPTSQSRVLNATGATLTATVTDAGGSGVASPSITVAVPTSVAGARSVTVTATDNAGNTSTASCGYRVTYKVVWLIPMAGTSSPTSVLRNTVVPFTFRLVDANGVGVNAAVASPPTSTSTACPSDPMPRVVSVSGKATTKKLGDGWWLAGWKAQTSWRGTCRLVTIGLNDGTGITAVLKVE